MDYANKTLADALAAQYVAGTLRGAARRRFEALLPGHPALRTAVADWQARLMPLTAVVVEQAPPAHTWERIELHGEGGTRTGFVVATNVYIKTAQGWRMVAHHASPGTAQETPEIVEAPSVLH